MVKLHEVQAANARLVQRQSLVVVSAGGSSGIGETTIRQLCTASGQASQGAGLRIYMIARNSVAVEKLFTEYKALSPQAEFIFVHAKDLALLKDVDHACEQIIDLQRNQGSTNARIDLLVMSQAIFDPWLGRKDSSEGLDVNMSLLYYSRMRMIDRLLPLLTARATSDGPAHVISVYAAGAESGGHLHADDLSLRNNYSFSDARTNVVHMKTMFFEHLANDHPDKLSLIHVYPGLVISPAFDQIVKPNSPLWFRWLVPILLPIAKVTVATPLPESGQRTLFLATDRYPAQAASNTEHIASTTIHGLPVATASDGKVGGGAYSCTVSGETNKGLDKAYAKLRQQGFYDRVWEHTYDGFETVQAGRVFTA